MKNAFDANVSRARPRVRLTAPASEISVEDIAAAVAAEGPAPTLAGAVKERAQALVEPKPTAVEAVQAALANEPRLPRREEGRGEGAVRASAEAPPSVVEVQTQPAPPVIEEQPELRRERLKERLKAVREHPKPEPLPETVAEAGVLAVERISSLQTELTKMRALNL